MNPSSEEKTLEGEEKKLEAQAASEDKKLEAQEASEAKTLEGEEKKLEAQEVREEKKIEAQAASEDKKLEALASSEEKPPVAQVLDLGQRLLILARRYRPIAWLILLVTSLVVFLLWMPTQMRMMLWNALAARGVLSGMLLMFSLLALSLVWSVGQRLDVWAFLFFNLRGSRPLWLDRVMLAFTQLGSGMSALVIGPLLFFANERLLAYEIVLGTITLWIMVELLKAVVRRSRPFVRVTHARIVGYREGGRSFPSGHTTQAFFTATLLASHFQVSIWLMLSLYAIAVLVGITRIYVGAHYPRDVLAGAILGSIWGLLAALVDGYILNG